jgi:hypothetical protein
MQSPAWQFAPGVPLHTDNLPRSEWFPPADGGRLNRVAASARQTIAVCLPHGACALLIVIEGNSSMSRLIAGVTVFIIFCALQGWGGPAQAASAPKPTCQLKNPDARIYGMELGNGDDFVSMIGENYALFYESKTSDFPWAVFLSQDRRQTMALQRYPGSGSHDFHLVEVQYARRKPSANLTDERSPYMGREPRHQRLPVGEFTTGNGIKLGMAKKAVLERLGDCFVAYKKRGQSETIRHELEDENSEFLKKARMPQYYSEYQFDGGKLVRFRFGYPYP